MKLSEVKSVKSDIIKKRCDFIYGVKMVLKEFLCVDIVNGDFSSSEHYSEKKRVINKLKCLWNRNQLELFEV